ncbi:hypothetical protein NM688_g6769 [Phlebia brevispora]|uniref:Uncharacterized protein n=1 Tax=Phlebia brevispora TaxID=194682 RepID=A0ACC1SCM5_9APHY|nr:hypothetical protein NM688_g6769 [Phlebia brevispora]
MAKKGAKAASQRPRKEAQDLDVLEENAEEYYDDTEENEDDGMLEMLSILKEFQKRKATKGSTSSTVFETKKNSLFAAARKNADIAVKDGVTYIEQYKVKIAELKAQEVSQQQHLANLSLLAGREEAVQALLDVFAPLLEDLSYRRADAINESSAMLEAHSVQRQRSRMKLVKQAKSRIDEDLEAQRVATDATALVKHYKALLLS